MSDNFKANEASEGKTLSWEEAVLWLKAQPDQDDLIKACFYDDPLQSAAERYYLSTEWLAVREELPQIGRVLDIGSGRGISAYAFAKDGWQVDALERPLVVVGLAPAALAGGERIGGEATS